MKRFITAIIWHSGCIMVSLSYLLPFTSIILKAQTISLGEAVDNDSLLWTTGGIADWFGQDSVYYYDGDAAQSGQLATREDSSWIQATVSGPGGLLFYWKFTGTLSLRFKLDGVKESICWTTYQWDSRTYIIQPGIHTLKWISSSTLGSNGGTGFLDKVVYIEEPPIPLGEAVDNESLTWTTGGDSDWVGQSMFSYYDGDAARSGNLRNGGDTSWIQAKVSGPGELSFYWKVTDITHLKFEINGVEKSICWADEEWELKSYILSPGTHILKWIYAPGSGCSGEAAFLDKVSWVEEPTVSLGEALDNDSLTWTTGGDAIWYGQTSIHYYDGDAARSGNLTSGVDSSWLQTTVSGPGGLSFFWKVSELSAITDLTFEIDGVEESLCWDFEEWRLQTFKIPSGIHTFKWIYAPVISRSGETGYIDKVLYIKGPAVLSPGWGETWNPREPNLIEWIDIEGTGPEVKLELYKGGSLIYTISASTDNSGNYDWFVPVILEPGSDFQVKLSSITDPSIFAYSEYFTIAESLFPPSFGGLLVLDGDDDFAHTEDHFELDIRDEAGESLTIEAWVYFKTFAHANILYKPEAYFLHGEYEWMSSLKNYCFGFFIWPAPDDLCSYIACRTVLPRAGYTFGWHHVAGVFNSENSDMKIYLNGKLFSDHSCSTIHNSDYPLYLGVGWWSGFMDGAIDEVRISDVARYLDEFDPPTTPFICDDHTRALWHFDELEGDTVFHDDCGYNNLLIGYNGAHASGGGNLGLLNQIIITPDNASLYIGQSQQFSAIGYDQGDNEVSITPIWTATGGTIATGESTVKKTLHDNSVSAVYTALETGNHIVVCTDSSSGIADTAQVSVISTGVLSDVVSPDEFKLFQNHPNPFNTETTIHFNVKQNCHVYMNVVDLLGREIAVLANSQFTPGIHEIVFNGRELPPGLYYYTIRMNSFYDMKRMVLIK